MGDIHGCLEPLNRLLEAVGFKKGVDRLICCGDIVDKGKNEKGVIKKLIQLKVCDHKKHS